MTSSLPIPPARAPILTDAPNPPSSVDPHPSSLNSLQQGSPLGSSPASGSSIPDASTDDTSTTQDSKADDTNERSLWLSEVMQEDPEALELRERSYPWTKMHSFGLLKKANFGTCREHLNRHRVLELVYQHLHSIGMHQVAFTLADESHLEFQRKDQKMDRTDLRLLVSLSVGPRDDLWDSTDIDSTVVVEERFDDDNGSVQYVEPLGGYSSDLISRITFEDEREFGHIRHAPLKALIVMLVKETTPVVTDDDKELFYVTMNSVCRSEHIFEHLCAMFHEVPETERDSVLLFIKNWIRFLGLFIGQRTLKAIELFLQKNPSPAALDILEMMKTLQYGNPQQDGMPPQPKIVDSTSVKLLDPRLTLAEPEPEEVARQITWRAHKLFSAIHPREFYFAIADRSLSSRTPALNELFEFGQRLKLLIAATIVMSPAPKGGEKDIMNQFINIMEQLRKLRNFESLSWCLSAFNMKCIRNLTAVFAGLPDASVESLKKLQDFDWKTESSAYRVEIEKTGLPTIPNMRYELSIVATDGYEGDDFVGDMINWEKRRKAGQYILRYYNYQNMRYNFHPVSQIQGVLERGASITKEALNASSIERESPVKHETV